MAIIDKTLNVIVFSLTVSEKSNRGLSVAIPNQSLFVLDSQNYETNLVAVLVVSDQKLKIVNCFVCCENVVFKNKQMNRFNICERKMTGPIPYFIVTLFNHPPFPHCTIGNF